MLIVPVATHRLLVREEIMESDTGSVRGVKSAGIPRRPAVGGVRRFHFSALLCWLMLAACGGGEGGEQNPPAASTGGAASQAAEITAEELEKGIGPIRTVELGEIDPARVARGEEIFRLKCSACHKLGERYIGPPLGDVLERRTPEFVLNMMLNSGEMTQKHPTIRELLAEYYTPMPDQGLTEEDARSVLDYIRQGGGE